MKLILLLFVSCLALQNGKGAPRTAVYKFVKCNPVGDQANCVTQQTPEMEWKLDLPSKLPASTAQYLEAEPVEDERKDDEETVEEETQLNESPMIYPGEDGSGEFEGSAAEGPYMADMSDASEAGSGEFLGEAKPEDKSAMRRLFPSRSLISEPKPTEEDLKEDHLLQL